MNELIPNDYKALLGKIKQRIRSAQYEALKTVNKELISLYWDIGRIIDEQQREKSWGRSVVETLAKDLQSEFPGIQGFSAQNLWYMRQFYLTYENNQKLQPLVGEISWTKHLIIMSKCKDDLEREFYLAALDDLVRMADENPSIGIILCKSKDKTIVEYALRESNKPIGVATYRIVTVLPSELKGQLPEPEQVAKLLEGI
jgi:predicted nuclease of restriction endonuclease-like (RecB) superfamily